MKKQQDPKPILFFLLILSISINVYFRLNTQFMPQIDRQATQEVYDNLKKKLAREASLTTPEKAKLLDLAFNRELALNKEKIDQEIATRSQELKSYYQDEKGWVYLLENDPYRWYRRVDNYLNTGRFGTKRIGNQDIDTLKGAPLGTKVETIKLHFYIGVYFYKFLHFINDKLSLMHILNIQPVVMAAVMIIIVFWVSQFFGISYMGSFIASLIVGLSPLILIRTSFGWFDTDVYNICLPLIIMALLAYSFRAKKQALFLFFSALFAGIYSAIWSIWWQTFYILVLSILIYQLGTFADDREKAKTLRIKRLFYPVLLFLLFSYLWVFIISGWEVVKNSFHDPLAFFYLRQDLALDNFWPNVSHTVSELQRSDFTDIARGVGGSLIFFGALIGMVWLIFAGRKLLVLKERKFLAVAVFTWLLVTLILSYFGRRFVMFLVTPVALLFAVFFDRLYDFLIENQSRAILFRKMSKNAYSLFLSGMLAVAVIVPLFNHASFIHITPIINDQWWNILTRMKQNTPEQAIVNAYWDQGDYIMSIGKRATITDAAWQTPMPYWFAKALLTNNEEQALGILRMVDSGGNQAFDALSQALKGNKLSSLELVHKMFFLEKDAGRILLGKYIQDKAAIEQILQFMYGPPVPGYMLAYHEMVDIMPVLSKLSNWDFQRLDLWEKFSQLDRRGFINYATARFGYDKKYALQLYNEIRLRGRADISDWVSRGTYMLYTRFAKQSEEKANRGFLLFENGICVDLEELKAYFRDYRNNAWIIPGKLVLVTKAGIKESVNKAGDSNYAVLVCQDNGSYKAVLLSAPLADSMFARMYFMNGAGLKHFKLVDKEESDVTSSYIYLYQMDWGNQ